MKQITSFWTRLVLGIIQSAGWIITVVLTLSIFVFVNLDIVHRYREGNIEYPALTINEVVDAYREYGKIRVINAKDALNDETTLLYYYDSYTTPLEERLNILQEQVLTETDAYKLVVIQRQISDIETNLEGWRLDKEIIASREIDGLTLYKQYQNTYELNAEYTLQTAIRVTTTDIYAWILVIMMAVVGVIVKIQGMKQGITSGFKLILPTTLRHATLSEKITPVTKEAEKICDIMNKEELYKYREKKLNVVGLKYQDIFDIESGRFLEIPNLPKIEKLIITDEYGKIRLVKDFERLKLRKQQLKTIRHLRHVKLKEIHIYLLLESTSEYRQRYDFGTSLKTENAKSVVGIIFSSMLLMLPLFTVASLFVYNYNETSLFVALIGTGMNIASMLIQMFSSYNRIVILYQKNIIKKCDSLLLIGNQLSITNENDNNWNKYIEQEIFESKYKNKKQQEEDKK